MGDLPPLLQDLRPLPREHQLRHLIRQALCQDRQEQPALAAITEMAHRGSPSKRVASASPPEPEAKRKVEEDEVKAKFRQLMSRQTEQTKATAALDDRITADFANMKTDMNDNNRRLCDRMDTMATGFETRIDYLEKELQRVAAVQAGGLPAAVTPTGEGGNTSPRAAGPGPHPHRSSSTARPATSNLDPK